MTVFADLFIGIERTIFERRDLLGELQFVGFEPLCNKSNSSNIRGRDLIYEYSYTFFIVRTGNNKATVDFLICDMFALEEFAVLIER
jgi:hypothetical protein